MALWSSIQDYIATSNPLLIWVLLFVVVGFIVAFGRGYILARKIQPNRFSWKIFRNEIFFSVINVTVSGFFLGGTSAFLTKMGWVQFHDEPATPWIIALEFAVYFFAFDTYFYWLHRLMHIEPIYKWVHKIHHRSIAPNPLTTLSVSPLESLVNGGFVPLFTAALTLHHESMALIVPTNIVMGLYVHNGFEFLPRWWNKTWLTKWFITTTFHDQHHRYFRGNYGGYTTIWDRLCGTVRPNYESTFEQVTTRYSKAAANKAAAGGA